MDYDAIAESMNKLRRSKNEPEIPKEQLIALLKKSEVDISSNKIDEDESKALAEFRKAENKRMDEALDQAIRDTPLFIKIFWYGIFSAIIYGIYYFFTN